MNDYGLPFLTSTAISWADAVLADGRSWAEIMAEIMDSPKAEATRQALKDREDGTES